MQMILDQSLKARNAHGSDVRRGKRKEARPIATKRPMHVTMRASAARGRFSLLQKNNALIVKTALQMISRKWNVKIYEWSNNGNHLHLVTKSRTREGFQGFLRELAGRIAMKVTGARKGNGFGKRFWDLTAFSRIIEWGRDFENAVLYVTVNRDEAAGRIAFRTRGRTSRLAGFVKGAFPYQPSPA